MVNEPWTGKSGLQVTTCRTRIRGTEEDFFCVQLESVRSHAGSNLHAAGNCQPNTYEIGKRAVSEHSGPVLLTHGNKTSRHKLLQLEKDFAP